MKKQMTAEEVAAWTKTHYPRAVAARKHQSKTHERALARKAASAALPKPLTRKQRQKALAQVRSDLKRAARKDKHARKLTGIAS